MEPLEDVRRKLHERTKCERVLGRLGRQIDDLRLDLRFWRKAAPSAVEDVAALGIVAVACLLVSLPAPVRLAPAVVARAGLRLYRDGGLGRHVLYREEWEP